MNVIKKEAIKPLRIVFNQMLHQCNGVRLPV